MMKTDFPIQCSCGTFKGVVHNMTPKETNHVVCACNGCQTYARTLQREEEMLDEHDGTTVFQCSPAKFEFIEGEENLALLQQTPNGSFRWYAKCCNTPIVNTLPTGSMPFMAIHPMSVDTSLLEHPLGTYIGPLRARVNKSFPRKQAKELRATYGALFGMLARFAPMFFGWKLRGDHKKSPLFDSQTLQPIRTPHSTLEEA